MQLHFYSRRHVTKRGAFSFFFSRRIEFAAPNASSITGGYYPTTLSISSTLNVDKSGTICPPVEATSPDFIEEIYITLYCIKPRFSSFLQPAWYS